MVSSAHEDEETVPKRTLPIEYTNDANSPPSHTKRTYIDVMSNNKSQTRLNVTWYIAFNGQSRPQQAAELSGPWVDDLERSEPRERGERSA